MLMANMRPRKINIEFVKIKCLFMKNDRSGTKEFWLIIIYIIIWINKYIYIYI